MIRRARNCTCPDCAPSFWDRAETALDHPIANACLAGVVIIAIVTLFVGITGVI